MKLWTNLFWHISKNRSLVSKRHGVSGTRAPTDGKERRTPMEEKVKKENDILAPARQRDRPHGQLAES